MTNVNLFPIVQSNKKGKNMPQLLSLYGRGQGEFLVLPPPIALQNAPNSGMTNYAIGQVAYYPATAPTAFYQYAGGGVWVQFASSDSSGNFTNITASGTLTVGGATSLNGDTTLAVGKKLNIPTGTNASAGTTAALTAGSIVVSNANVTSNTIGFFATHTRGTVTVPQSYRISARSPGVSFTIMSSDPTDTSTVDYILIN